MLDEPPKFHKLTDYKKSAKPKLTEKPSYRYLDDEEEKVDDEKLKHAAETPEHSGRIIGHSALPRVYAYSPVAAISSLPYLPYYDSTPQGIPYHHPYYIAQPLHHYNTYSKPDSTSAKYQPETTEPSYKSSTTTATTTTKVNTLPNTSVYHSKLKILPPEEPTPTYPTTTEPPITTYSKKLSLILKPIPPTPSEPIVPVTHATSTSLLRPLTTQSYSTIKFPLHKTTSKKPPNPTPTYPSKPPFRLPLSKYTTKPKPLPTPTYPTSFPKTIPTSTYRSRIRVIPEIDENSVPPSVPSPTFPSVPKEIRPIPEIEKSSRLKSVATFPSKPREILPPPDIKHVTLQNYNVLEEGRK